MKIEHQDTIAARIAADLNEMVVRHVTEPDMGYSRSVAKAILFGAVIDALLKSQSDVYLRELVAAYRAACVDGDDPEIRIERFEDHCTVLCRQMLLDAKADA